MDNPKNLSDNNVSTKQTETKKEINHEWLVTLLLAFFLGALGVHRFYAGKIGTGILMILTLGGFGIWYTIDVIIIACGLFKKKDGTVISVYR
jgi:TM2 domain-containing membrane protein YozV